LAGVDLEDFLSVLYRRGGNRHSSVKATRPQKGRIEDVGTVGCGKDDGALVLLESVHFREELVESLLTLVMAAPEAGPPPPTDGVELVNKDDARGVLLGILKETAYPLSAYTDEHLNKV
jgi:hypothetical protein